MPRLVKPLLGLIFLLACASPASAGAATYTLVAAAPLQRDCAAEQIAAGHSGADGREWTAPSSGLLTARLKGDETPDWDLALFRDGRATAASTNFGSNEDASTWVQAGDRIWVQGCRRDGEAKSVPLTLSLYAASLPAPSGDRISLESVPISGAEDLAQLDALGLDVTEDTSPGAATVALYSDAQRAALHGAGFTSSVRIADLAAYDARDRRLEDRRAASSARSALPTGRDQYRQYTDYTTELKNLAEQNPVFVRAVNLSPTADTLTIEGRPIQGIEIAGDVNRSDDGRPVYLQMGLHHAREWPSGEWPMEFAHTLVDGYRAHDPRITALLDSERVVIVPVVNVDGFIASRSFGTTPLDDDQDATLAFAVANAAAYIRKNCRPTGPSDAQIPCALRAGSGVDLNRNYGYYWGGPGSSTDTTTQGYRGTGPFSEPETRAVHRYVSSIQPTVLITNHTFTDDGKWLRQPGFDANFLPQQVVPGYSSQGCGSQSNGNLGAYTPDETAMKELGDAMAAATGFTSELSYETLCDITGATEDWNYYAQGTYGYTPEARGANFHASYATSVATEYVGDATHAGLGVKEAYLRAGERAANPPDHSIIAGTVPPGATLKLIKDFVAPTFNQPALNVSEHLETTLSGPASGSYAWHALPSDRPAITGPNPPQPNPGDEQWTMTCQRSGQGVFTKSVEVARGEQVTVDWANDCGIDTPNLPPVASFNFTPPAPLAGQQVNLFSTSTDDGAIAATDWDLDDDGQFDDATGLVATVTFAAPGAHNVSVRVTDDDGALDQTTRVITVSAPGAPAQPDAGGPGVKSSATCRGVPVTILGTPRSDVLVGTQGDDSIRAGRGRDTVRGLGGDDVICGGRGRDRLSGGAGDDGISGNGGRDRIYGGPGRDILSGGLFPDRLSGGGGSDRCRGGPGRDRIRGC